MDEKLNSIMNYLNAIPNLLTSIHFGYSDPKFDTVTINIVGAPQSINRMNGSEKMITTFTIYCLFTEFIDSFSTATQIYKYLQKNKIINSELKILTINPPQRIAFKQNKHLYILEFSLIGL